MPREFTCLDCGIAVTSFVEPAANDQDICFTCQWLRSIKDPVQRELIRQTTHVLFKKKEGDDHG
jgi:hypothetical protein